MLRPPKYRWRSVLVLTGLVLLGALAAPALKTLRLDNNLERWLSADDPAAVELARFYEWFPREERVVVSWDGCNPDDPRLGLVADRLGGIRSEEGDHVGGLPEVQAVDSPLNLLARIERRKVEPDEAQRRLQGTLLGEDGSAALLVTLTPQASEDPGQAIRKVRETVLACDVNESELHIGGEAVTAGALDEEVRLSMWNATDPLQRPPVFLFSALLGLLAAFVALRSWRLGAMVLAAACLTAIITTAIIGLSGATMNMVLIVMPTLLIVLTLSAAIHLVNYWRHASQEGHADPVREAIAQGWRPCTLAAATTLIGLLSLLISPLSPVRDFGLFSSLGVVLGLTIVLVSVPAMLRLTMKRHRLSQSAGGLLGHAVWSSLGDQLRKRRKAIVVVAGLMFIGCIAGLQDVQTDVRVIRYFPSDSKLVEDSRFIEQNVGGLSPIEILVRFDKTTPAALSFLERMEFVRSIENKVRTRSEVTGTISLADFETTYERPSRSASTFKKIRYHKRSHETEQRIKNGAVRGSTRYFAAPDVTPEREWDRKDPCNEVWRIAAQTRLLNDRQSGTLSSDIDALVGNALPDIPGVSHSITGSLPLFLRAQRAMLASLTWSFGLAFAIIACTLSVMLRDIRAGVLSVLPCLMPVGLVFGAMAWNGMVLDIGTILTASVALGIAVDDTLHLLTWFRNGIKNGESRETAVVNALKHCGPAMTQTTVVVSISLLALYPAQLSLISQFGWVMAALLVVALVAELVLLPVFLLGPLGRWIEQRETRTSATHSDAKPAPVLSQVSSVVTH